jgi:ribosomal protein L31E
MQPITLLTFSFAHHPTAEIAVLQHTANEAIWRRGIGHYRPSTYEVAWRVRDDQPWASVSWHKKSLSAIAEMRKMIRAGQHIEFQVVNNSVKEKLPL